MIVVDSSALIAWLKGEPGGAAAGVVLKSGRSLAISAGTLAEVLIVADRNGFGSDLRELLRDASIDVVPVTAPTAERMARAYARWGKGVHPAGLNLGDCFAYALAEELGAPLLFVGEDFRRTDLRAAV